MDISILWPPGIRSILKHEIKTKGMGLGLECGEITTSFIWIVRSWGMKSITVVGSRLALAPWQQ